MLRVVKRQIGHVKTRYRGLAKNGAQVPTLLSQANLWMARKHLLATTGVGMPERRIAAAKRGGAMQNERLMAVKKLRQRSS